MAHTYQVSGIVQKARKLIESETGRRYVYLKIIPDDKGLKYMKCRSFNEQYFDIVIGDWIQTLTAVLRSPIKGKSKQKDYCLIYEMLIKPCKDRHIKRLRAVNCAMKGVK